MLCVYVKDKGNGYRYCNSGYLYVGEIYISYVENRLKYFCGLV